MSDGSLSSLGRTERVTADSIGRPDEPPDGQHDWGIFVHYRFTEAEAAQSSEGLEQHLDMDKIAYWTPVCCMRCEHAHGDVGGLSCPGDPDRYEASGRPVWRVDGVWTPDPWHRRGER